MISFINSHPWYTALAIWLLAGALFVLLLLVRKGSKGYHDGGYVNQPSPGIPALLDLPGEYRIRPGDRPSRIAMRSRFVPVDNSITRGLAMADQIVADQRLAHEEPGPRVHAPAPGDPNYHEPSQVVAVSVGPYTVHMMRGANAGLSEARPDGAEWPVAEIPHEWSEPLVAFAMEVLRLREGWSVG